MLVELGEGSVSGLGRVRRLDLSYNKLSSVPGLASLGPSLQQLSVSGNMVKQLTQDSLHGLTSLQVSEDDVPVSISSLFGKELSLAFYVSTNES